MGYADVVVAVTWVLLLFAVVIGVQMALREIGWYRARLELRAVERQRARELEDEAARSGASSWD